MRGSKLLKASSILMIIGAIFTVLVSALVLLGVGLLGDVSELAEQSGTAIVISVLLLVAGIGEFVAGVMGIRNSKNPDGACRCFSFGMILIILCGVSLGTSIVNGSFSWSNIIPTILPMLYTYGAYFVKENK